MHVGVGKVLLLTTLVLGVIASCSNLWTERTELASAAIWGERAPGEVTEWDMFGGDSDLKRHAAPNGPRAKPRMDAPGKALVAKYEDAAEKVERLKRLVSQAKAQQGFMHKIEKKNFWGSGGSLWQIQTEQEIQGKPAKADIGWLGRVK